MNFNSGAFLVFLPVVTAVYWLLPHRGRKYWLLAASYFFYLYANLALILLLLASTAVDYCCGRGIERFRGRRGKARKLLNILIVFTLCGLWHGARWTYVLWGLYAAFWLCLESLLDLKNRFGPAWDCPLGRLARRCVMFLIFVPAALLFRADSVAQLGVIFPRLFTAWGFGGAYLQAALDQLGLTTLSLVQLVLCIVAMIKLYAWGQYDLLGAKTDSQSAARLCSCVYLIVVVALCWLALLQTQDAAIFAYFQF